MPEEEYRDRNSYQCVWPEVERNHNYRPIRKIIRKKYDLVTALSRYKAVSFDIESTGFNPFETQLVGFSFCGDLNVGFYVPIAHKTGENAEEGILETFLEVVYKEEIRLIIYNMKFDILYVLEQGYKLSDRIEIEDMMLAVFLMDSNMRFPSLKWSSKRYLGIVMKSFDDLVGDAGDISMLSPEECLDYCTDDAICTIRLAKIVYGKLSTWIGKAPSGKGVAWLIYHECDRPFMRNLIKTMRKPIRIDLKYADQLRIKLEADMKEKEKQAYGILGYKINLRSTRQKSEAVKKLGVDGSRLEKTKSGDYSMRSRELTKIDHPIADLFIEYNSLEKTRNSYVQPLLDNKYGEWGRPNYNLVATASGRLSSSKDKKNDYFMKLNMQNLTKPEAVNYYVYEGGDFFGFDIREEKEDGCIGMIEGQGGKYNVRRAFIPNSSDYYVVSVDYVSEELVILANMTKDPKWLLIFKEHRDPHRETAIAIWGEENYNSDIRKKAKTTNFSILYGATAGSVAYRMQIPKTEAEFIVNGFFREYRGLLGWMSKAKRTARRNGYALTYFGRPRSLKYYYNKGDSKAKSYADRVAVNHPIQGTGADVFKVAVNKLSEGTFEKYPDEIVRPFAYVHDEIDFLVRKDMLVEACQSIKQNMEFYVGGWEIQLTTEFEIGDSMGSLFPVKLLEDKIELDFESVT